MPSPWPANGSPSRAAPWATPAEGAAALRRAARGNLAALVAVAAREAQRAEDLRETIADVVASGCASHTAVAIELNRREIEAPRGGQWYPASVARLRERLAGAQRS
jgi:hypothetical protein